MNNQDLEKLIEIFKKYPAIKLVYFFGSKATGDDGPMSDYDFAFYCDEKDGLVIFDLRLELLGQLSDFFKTDKVDVVMLNLSESPELKYNIIKDGKLIYEIEPFKVLVEPRILNEYFDFYYLLKKYNLTKA